MARTKLYVTSDTSYPDEKSRAADFGKRIWTVSTDPNAPGWETDSGCDRYGVTHAQAQFLADAANEKLAREGDAVWWPDGDMVN